MSGTLSSVLLTTYASMSSKDAGPYLTATKITKVPGSTVAGNKFAQQLWVALVVTIAIFVVVAVIRRYAAARTAGRVIGDSAFFAVYFQSSEPTGDFKNGVADPKAGRPAVPKVRGLLVGTDNRTSTSKLNAWLWTAILVYFLLAIALIFGLQASKYTELIHSISPLYLVLLGGPFAAAVLAKGIVSSAVSAGTAQKSTADTPRIADIFSDDDGNTDLVDTQYVIFNLLVAGIVVVQFVHAPGSGAPQIPDFLAILTGASAATYVANKGISTGNNAPSIDRIVPASARMGGNATVLGSDLLAQGDSGSPMVYVDGNPATVEDGATASQVNFVIPPGLATGTCTVSVRTPSGAETTVRDKLTVIADNLIVTSVDPATPSPGGKLTLTGSGFFAPGDIAADQKPTPNAKPATVYLVSTHAHRRTPATPRQCPPIEPVLTDRQITVQVPASLKQDDGAGTFGLMLTRGGHTYNPTQVITIK